MIIILSNSEDPHVDLVEPTLKKMGVEFVRINTDELFVQGSITFTSGGIATVDTGKRRFSVDTAISIWNRRPKTPSIDKQVTDIGVRSFCEREAQSALFGILQASNAVWINHPDTNETAKRKVDQIHRAKTIGLCVPSTCISNDPKKVEAFLKSCKDGSIYKPLTWGVVQPDDEPSDGLAIFTTRIDAIDEIVHASEITPGIYQEEVPKQYEVRVTIFGKKVFAVKIDTSNAKVDVRKDLTGLQHTPITLPGEIEEKCLRLARSYDLLYAAVDLIVTPDGECVFLELNPNGQWGWLEKKTDLPMCDALVNLLLHPC